ncbi:hypothetical protein FE782_17465 [Paenibacillus antri]|uniref:DUF4838 domain-containing protein n=1 Tax=Paenibacillus antri TaxID=2582848 RepID=A0A5R9G4Y7_9BACL|nr:hypothetical protein [Paenibacillus antri]TLS50841.1 hypothetical protein FE782_17465 [Paenibacillus antri]
MNRTQHEHPVLAFAREEWARLSASQPRSEGAELILCTWSDLEAQDSERLSPDIKEKMRASTRSDDYIIAEAADRLVLAGKYERATLFALYQYAREAWGLRRAYPGTDVSFDEEETIRGAATGNFERFYSPRFERRGFVVENYKDPAYLKLLIDWLAKNGQNEIFFTFMLWDAVRDEVAPEIAKRGLRVTLGGHSMKFFTDRSESFRAIQGDHPYTAKKQFDYKDESWFPALFDQIAAYCKDVPNLTTLSLWPEDVADRSGAGFLSSYIRFAERLKAHLRAAGIEADVEHIAYNAGLSWDMLELGDAPPSDSADVLFAYWGRDYRFGYEASPHENEHRARKALEEWTAAVRGQGRRTTIFEYYSDHFMLSSLFPALPRRIAEDVEYYAKLGVDGMVDLIVPYKGPLDYPWTWAHGFNSFVFARALWGESLEDILNEYYAGYPVAERRSVRATFERIEETVAEATRWNVPLFPARAVDVERAVADAEQADAVIAMLRRIQAVLGTSAPNGAPVGSYEKYVRCLIEQASALETLWREKRERL